MKKAILFSFFIVASAFTTSCTADAIQEVPAHAMQADDTSGQNGQIPPPPPPPPPGLGTGA